MGERGAYALARQSRSSVAPPRRVLQRKCACEKTGETCARCAQRHPLQRWAASGKRAASIDLPPIVENVLTSPSRPLDAATRAYMEPRFGRSFADVRVHTDGQAAASARAVNAEAYTVGTHIAFGSGRYAPAQPTGWRLVAHELAHVMQQSAGGITPNAGHEVEADRAAERIGAGQTANAMLPARIGLQRQESNDVPPGIGNPIVHRIMDMVPFGTTSQIASAAIAGLAVGLYQELKGPTGTILLGKLATFEAKDVKALYGGYLLGLVEGLVSPITDLFGLAHFAEQLESMAVKFTASALAGHSDLLQELHALSKPLGDAKNALGAAFAKMRETPLKTVEVLLSLPGKISIEAEKKAYQYGLDGGHSIGKSFLEPWEGKKEKKEEDSTITGMISGAVEGFKEKLIDVPWAKVGNKVGYAVGFAVINVALLFLSEGVGNAIVQAASKLGEVSKSFGFLARGVERAADFLKVTGTVIRDIEQLVNAVMSKILKPLEPILEPLMKPFTELIEALKRFLKKLGGVAEKEAADAAKAAAAKGAKALVEPPGGQLHPPTLPTEHPPSPPVPAVKREPPAGGPHASAGAAPARQMPEPSPSKQLPDTPKSSVAEPKLHQQAPVQKPVGEGHHVQVTERGVEICSLPPCPLLNIQYADEMKANKHLAEAWEEIQKLRTQGNFNKAADLAAELHKNLKWTRVRAQVFSNTKVSAAQRERLEKIFEAAEHYGAEFTEDGAAKLVSRLQGKSATEIDAALNELETAVTDLPGNLGALKRRADPGPAQPEGRAATAVTRAQPGRVTGGADLPDVTGQWFPEIRDPVTGMAIPGTRDIRVARVPGQVAQRMRGLDFRNFDEFREMFWQMVANDPVLRVGWTPANLTRMRNGYAPMVRTSERMGGGANAVYQINHKQALKSAGDVYNLDNLEIVSPAFHSQIGD